MGWSTEDIKGSFNCLTVAALGGGFPDYLPVTLWAINSRMR